MSVIVKDMEMPKSCIWRDGRCPLLGDDDGCKLQDCQEEWTWEDQYKGCPLSEAYEGDDPRADVYYLAEEIGIHQLYSLVVALRGEPEPCKDAVRRDLVIGCVYDILDKIDQIVPVPIEMFQMARNDINDLPSVRPEIRCEDCDSGETAGKGIYCLTHSTFMRCGDYCSYWKKGGKDD